MPNQRKKTKVNISLWLERDDLNKIRALAKTEGKSLSRFVREKLEAGEGYDGTSRTEDR